MSKENKNNFKNPYILFAIIARVASSISIIIFPLAGLILFIIFDMLDSVFFVDLAHLNFRQYHRLDKNLDWVGHVCMLIAAISRLSSGVLTILVALLVFRLIGQIIFMKVKNDKIFILFPNFFQIFFLANIILWEFGTTNPLSKVYFPYFTIFILFQLLLELFLHITFPWYLKTYGYPAWSKKLGFKDKPASFWK